ncbi:MAG: hypothetical protein JSR79_07185 [Proteobacteria bacterium]|nr:hypothetical protein [Pseudomonadota bacterium]
MGQTRQGVEYEVVVGRQDCKPQRRRKAKANAFSPRKRQVFLDTLAYTCNVRMAAEQAGIDISTAYYHRARDPVFVEQWREALATGYDTIEALVLEHGGAGQPLAPADPTRATPDAPPPFDFDRALAVLRQYRSARNGESRLRRGIRPIAATRDETNAALRKALAAVRKRMANEAE